MHHYQNKLTTTQTDTQKTHTTTSSQYITEKQNKKKPRPPSLRMGEAALNQVLRIQHSALPRFQKLKLTSSLRKK